MYLTKYIERMGTGTGDMIRRCREVRLREPEFSISDGFKATIWRKKLQDTGQVTGQVEPWVEQVLRACALRGELKSVELQEAVRIKHRETFQRNYLDHLLNEQLIERTIPGKPKSKLQKYRLSQKGQLLLESLSKNEK